jgi:hypothetical protein
LLDALVNPQEGGLDDILCQLMVPNDQEGRSYCLDLVFLDERFQPGRIALLELQDCLNIVHGYFSYQPEPSINNIRQPYKRLV